MHRQDVPMVANTGKHGAWPHLITRKRWAKPMQWHLCAPPKMHRRRKQHGHELLRKRHRGRARYDGVPSVKDPTQRGENTTARWVDEWKAVFAPPLLATQCTTHPLFEGAETTRPEGASSEQN